MIDRAIARSLRSIADAHERRGHPVDAEANRRMADLYDPPRRPWRWIAAGLALVAGAALAEGRMIWPPNIMLHEHPGESMFAELHVSNPCGGTSVTHEFVTEHGAVRYRWQEHAGCGTKAEGVAPDDFTILSLPPGVVAVPDTLQVWERGPESLGIVRFYRWEGM